MIWEYCRVWSCWLPVVSVIEDGKSGLSIHLYLWSLIWKHFVLGYLTTNQKIAKSSHGRAAHQSLVVSPGPVTVHRVLSACPFLQDHPDSVLPPKELNTLTWPCAKTRHVELNSASITEDIKVSTSALVKPFIMKVMSLLFQSLNKCLLSKHLHQLQCKAWA